MELYIMFKGALMYLGGLFVVLSVLYFTAGITGEIRRKLWKR